MKFNSLLTLLTTLVFMTAPLAQAMSLGKRPLKLLTCELMLQSSLESLSVKDNVLPILRDAGFKVKKAVPASANDGADFKNLFFSGALNKMSVAKATAIVQRLNGIEQNLLNRSLDEQVVSVEIRGEENIRKALAEVDANEAKLAKIYEEQAQGVFSKMRRLGGHAADTLAVSIVASTAIGSFIGAVTSATLVNSDSFMNNEGAYLLSVAAAGLMIDYQLKRHDWGFNSLKDFLNDMLEKKSATDFYISSNKFAMPTEFHQMLMSDQADADARAIALKHWGGSFADHVIAEMMDEFNMRRDVNNAGENFRRTYLDQIAFYDEATNEPVWLFFYRAFRKRPESTPMKPKDKGRLQRDYGWVGEMAPQPIPVPVRAQ